MNRFLSGVRLMALVVVVGIAGVTSAWFAAPARAEASAAPAADHLRALDDAWSRAAGMRDLDAVASYYSEDTVAYPPNAKVVNGRAAAQAVWAGYFEDPGLKVSWKATHAEVSKSGELGFTSGAYTMTYTGADGNPARDVGKFLCVWRLQSDGTWKATHDMWNSDGE